MCDSSPRWNPELTCRHQFFWVATDGVKLQACLLDEVFEISMSRNADTVPDRLQTNSKRDERLDVT
ncbi:hypothetical protein F1880_007794 [Penicillium rolfsii]|nr:hypothetical protein F1880_007794 [Penicillium rolfsii]